MTDLIEAIEAGRQAARQAKEDAYVQARRPIVNSYADQEAQQKIAAGAQDMTQSAAQESRAAAEGTRKTEDYQRSREADAYQMGAHILNFAADSKMSAQDALAKVPPQYLKIAALDTPEAQKAFLDRHGSQSPDEMKQEAQFFGGEDPIVGHEAVKNNETGKEGIEYIRKSGRREQDFSISSKPNSASGAYTDTAGARRAADGTLISKPSDADVTAFTAAKAAGGAYGKVVGAGKGEDVPASDTATRAAANGMLQLRDSEKEFQRAANLAFQQVNGLSAGYGANTVKVAGTPAYQLAQTIKTMQGQLTLGGLMDLKAKSKNGASGLGALSDKEGALLASILGSLDSGQDPGVLKSNIAELSKVHAQRLAAQEKAFQQTYGSSVEDALKKGGHAPSQTTVSLADFLKEK